MAQIRSSSLFLATVVLLFTAVAVEAQLRFIMNPLCRTSDYKRLCTRMVGRAGNLNQASANALQSTLNLARRARSKVYLLKPAIAHLEPQSQASIMSTCTDHFDNTVTDIEDSIQALRENEIGSLRAKLSAAYRSDCDDELQQFGVNSAKISRYIKLLRKEVDNCLAVVMQN